MSKKKDGFSNEGLDIALSLAKDYINAGYEIDPETGKSAISIETLAHLIDTGEIFAAAKQKADGKLPVMIKEPPMMCRADVETFNAMSAAEKAVIQSDAEFITADAARRFFEKIGGQMMTDAEADNIYLNNLYYVIMIRLHGSDPANWPG